MSPFLFDAPATNWAGATTAWSTNYISPTAWSTNYYDASPPQTAPAPLSGRVLARMHLARFHSGYMPPPRPAGAQSLRRVAYRAPREYRLRPGMRRLARV